MRKNFSPHSQVSILLAESDVATGSRVARLLEQAGYRTVIAQQGEAAKRLFTELMPDMVLTEYSIAREADGLELARLVKENDPFVPVILASECIDPKGLDEAVRCGVNSFISKPFDEGGLLSVIQKHAPDVTVKGRIVIPSDVPSPGGRPSDGDHASPATEERPFFHHYATADIEYKLLRRNALLEAVNRDLEELCDAISHDLRGPLARLQGYVSILNDEHSTALSQEERHCLERIGNSCQEIRQRLDGLVQVSYYSRCSIVSRPIDLSRMAAEIVSSLVRRQGGENVRFLITPGLSSRGDEVLIKLALFHLLDNALKFTRESEEPTIVFGVAGDGGRRVFFVRDNGIGFPARLAASLFKPFTRLNDPSHYPGDGLGLAIVQRIIKRHGGRIWCDGEEGHGATFYFTL